MSHEAESTGVRDQRSQGGDSRRELVKCGDAARLGGSGWLEEEDGKTFPTAGSQDQLSPFLPTLCFGGSIKKAQCGVLQQSIPGTGDQKIQLSCL